MGDTSGDIKITFLNDVVKEEVYVEQPLGVETNVIGTGPVIEPAKPKM